MTLQLFDLIPDNFQPHTFGSLVIVLDLNGRLAAIAIPTENNGGAGSTMVMLAGVLSVLDVKTVRKKMRGGPRKRKGRVSASVA